MPNNHLAITGLANVTGQPAITVPMTWSEDAGIAIGAELIGRNGEEHDQLALAAQLGQARPWWNRRRPLQSFQL
ncbi:MULTISPECIES: amidase family protein [unclassified Pseudomonas]|uniref:amidase family protein n=1 Tax=unclassified Pseudomonas TaxID=196821 RepID=UPI0011140F39|nr:MULTISPECIES: amidase family protein [unclassified Pseudomonas]